MSLFLFKGGLSKYNISPQDYLCHGHAVQYFLANYEGITDTFCCYCRWLLKDGPLGFHKPRIITLLSLQTDLVGRQEDRSRGGGLHPPEVGIPTRPSDNPEVDPAWIHGSSGWDPVSPGQATDQEFEGGTDTVYRRSGVRHYVALCQR